MLTLVDGVATIVLDRPAARNALTEQMVSELTEALEHAAADEAVKAVVLTGSGSAFCAGADLSRFDAATSAAVFRFESHRLTDLVALVERIEKPVVAAVNGIAVGLGVQLALACDLRVGAESASFGFTEGRLGLVPTHGGVARLVKLVGLAQARNLLLTSGTVDAVRALELGLLTDLVPDADLDAAARRMVDRALLRAPQSYGLVKRLLLIAASSDMQSAMAAETIGQSLLIGTSDHAEGRLAAKEHRKPRFTGR